MVATAKENRPALLKQNQAHLWPGFCLSEGGQVKLNELMLTIMQ